MHDAGPPEPLENDPAREAVDSLRGYSYQMLRSVETWLDLKEGEILVLEGAEDLDRITSDSAIVEQVKDTVGSGNTTLRSANATSALGNFWSHLERNAGITIHFRYLTTSGIGQERGDDLQLDAPGIEVWNSIKEAPGAPESLTAADTIRLYLAGRSELPRTMLAWLATATAPEFISKVVEPFEWVTSQPDATQVRGRIAAKLVELGEPRGIGASSAIGAFGNLHVEAWANVTDPGRPPLRRGDLIRVFEAAGTTAVPTGQLLALMRQVTGAADPQGTLTRADRALVAPPRGLVRRLSRTKIEAAIEASLTEGTVLIHGSTGMGKTSLAVASLAGTRNVGWIDLRDRDVGTIVSRLNAAADFLTSEGRPFTIVLDDLDAGDDPRTIVPAVGRLVDAIMRAGGSLIVTSAQRPAPRLADALGLDERRVFEAAAFDDEEIARYFLSAGCPKADASNWSKIVFGSTSGHPQLVDARLGALQRASWPRPDITEFISSPPEIVDVRAEARRMVAALPEDERELLARASLLVGHISRQRLMAIGRISPPVNEPGHVIDRLAGPWLEVNDDGDLRASPLLRNLGVDTRGQEWSQRMHADIAWAWLSERSLFASDVSTLLMHTIVGGSAGPLVQLLPSLLQAPEEVWKQIGETAGMFAHIGIGDGPPPFRNPIDLAAFRILQLRIAEEVGPDQAMAVTNQALKEAEAREGADVGTEFFDFLFLWQLLREGDSTQSLERLIDLGTRFVRLGGRVRQRLIDAHVAEGFSDDDWPDVAKFLKLSMIPAVVSADRLEELLDILNGRDASDRKTILEGYAGEADAAALALDRVWLGEAQRETPEWDRLALLLDRTIEVALAEGVRTLAVAAAALLVRVTDENVRDAAAALANADRLISRIGDAPRIVAAKAKVLWRSGRAGDSLSLYEEALAQFDLPRPWLTDALREAGMAAAKARNWRVSASRFTAAVPVPDDQEPLARRIGLMFDRGLALHLTGDSRGAVEAFGQALRALIEDGQRLPAEPLLSARQLGSHAIKIVRMAVEGEQSPEVISMGDFVGRCSSLDTLEWGDQRVASLDVIVQTLIELDLVVPGGPTVAIPLACWLRNSRDLLTMSVAGQCLTKLALATGDVAPIISDTVKQITYLNIAVAERESGGDAFAYLDEDPPTPALDDGTAQFLLFRVLASFVTLMAKSCVAELPIAQWRADLPADPSYDPVRALIGQIEIAVVDRIDPWPQVVGSNPSWDIHAAAALGSLLFTRSPDELITAHGVAAHYLAQPQFMGLVSAPLANLVTSAWLEMCDAPARLVTPRLTVPAIRQSVTSTTAGWTRTKAVLTAALGAVSIGTARNIRSYVTNLPG